jgi:hypothetical protein
MYMRGHSSLWLTFIAQEACSVIDSEAGMSTVLQEYGGTLTLTAVIKGR